MPNTQYKYLFILPKQVLIKILQLGWKIAIFLIYRKEMAEILEDSNNFWPLNEFGDAYTSKFYSQHKFLSRFFRVYVVNLSILCTQFVLIPFISSTEDQQTVMMYYKEKEASFFYAQFVYVVHTIYMFFGCVLVAGFDCLFFYLIGHIVSELKMIAVAFSGDDISKEWTYEERFKIAVQHHIFILRYFDFSQNVTISFLFFFQICK